MGKECLKPAPARLVVMQVLTAGVLAALVLAPAAAAQAADQATLWLHITNDPRTYYMTFEREDAAHDSDASGYNVLGLLLTHDLLGVGCPEGFCAGPLHAQWSIAMTPELAEPVALDTSRPIVMSVTVAPILSIPQVGSVLNPSPGLVGDISSTLSAGDTVIATGTASVTDVVDTYVTVIIEAEAAVDEIPGGPLTWTVVMQAVAGGAVIGASDETGWSHIVLPVPPVVAEAPEPVENVTAPDEPEPVAEEPDEEPAEEPEEQESEEKEPAGSPPQEEPEPVQEAVESDGHNFVVDEPQDAGLPATGALVLLLSLAVVAAVRRR